MKIPFYSEQPGSTEPDVHHIDFRVGKILSAKRHPDADTLFVEESKQQNFNNYVLLSAKHFL